VLAAAALSGCIVPEDMPALREELGYASVEETDLVVKARASTQTPTVGETVNLSADTERYTDTVTLSWTVNGTTYDDRAPSLSFDETGTIPVEVRAEAPDGTQAVDEIALEVQPNAAPEAALEIEDREDLWSDEAVLVRADGSTDPDGDELTYDWRLDGEPIEAGSVLETQLAPGPHEVAVTVTDGLAEDTATAAFAVDHRLEREIELTTQEPQAEIPLQPAAGLDQLELSLTHSTPTGLESVNLSLEDAEGGLVAADQTDPGPSQDEASLTLTIDGGSLAAEPHTLAASLERGTETVGTIEGVFTYSPLPGAAG
jgi:hypothetical protein